MNEYPGIVVRPGAIGPRPGLADGPDVWEVARVLRGVARRCGDVVNETVELTGLTQRQVEAALHYYSNHRREIDRWMARNDEIAFQAETAWRNERGLPPR